MEVSCRCWRGMGATASCTKDSLTSFGPSDLNININRIHPQEGGVEGLADWVGDSRVLFQNSFQSPVKGGRRVRTSQQMTSTPLSLPSSPSKTTGVRSSSSTLSSKPSFSVFLLFARPASLCCSPLRILLQNVIHKIHDGWRREPSTGLSRNYDTC